MTAAELIELLATFPPGTVVTVWDPLLDQPCHVLSPISYLDASQGCALLIDSNAQRVTEEDLA